MLSTHRSNAVSLGAVGERCAWAAASAHLDHAGATGACKHHISRPNTLNWTIHGILNKSLFLYAPGCLRGNPCEQ